MTRGNERGGKRVGVYARESLAEIPSTILVLSGRDGGVIGRLGVRWELDPEGENVLGVRGCSERSLVQPKGFGEEVCYLGAGFVVVVDASRTFQADLHVKRSKEFDIER
jgi:hypothetical protein